MLTILKNLFVFFKFRNFCEILLHKKRVGNIVTKFKVQNTTVSSVEDLSDDYNNRQQPIYESAEQKETSDCDEDADDNIPQKNLHKNSKKKSIDQKWK